MVRRLSVKGGAVDRDGVVTPKGTRVVAENGASIVVKVPGHHYWSGRGMSGYAGTEFEVYRVISKVESGDRAFYEVERMISFSPRAMVG